jgi:hypothetical protein
MPEKHVFGPVAVALPAGLTRADLEFYGIDHFCPSYVAQIFFNDPDVDEASAGEERPSYAGRFAIFGHQRCAGDEGHCVVHTHLRRFDDRPSHPLTRAFKRVVVTDALRRHADAGEITVTVVVTADPTELEHSDAPLLRFEGLQITTFAAAAPDEEPLP